ncbi:DUF4249 family protein [Chitinophaga sancti]|uniref:DUF4249 family protein n=1 Tax=Chitinophaga sancti TaxID=1004 RepID=UPI003F7A87DD
MKNIITALLITLALSGCEKVLDLKYKDNKSSLIIEGNITNESGPYFVKLSRSVKLTATGDYPVVDGALVIISDDAGNTDTLMAKGNGIYQTNTINGIENRTYTLVVRVDNEVYTAHSTMPAFVPFDSIKVETIKVVGDTQYNLIPVYTDPVYKGNNYRFVLTVNDKLINQHFVQQDDVRNGVVNTSRLEINDDDLELKKGDTISMEMQCVDDSVALYYKTLALIGDSGPGGGTTPNNPRNNISNGALGLFSAHTSVYKGVKILF